MKRMRSFLVWLFAAVLTLGVLPSQPARATVDSASVSVFAPAVDKNFQVAFTSAARTASANSSAFDVIGHETLVCYLSVTANGGTSPTLDVKFQDSPDGGTTWFDVAGTSFTQVTGSTSSQVVSATRKFANKIRCVATIGGTSPTFTFSVHFMSY
ncbi:MAG: hypothetical protein AB1631_20615 [Acidobacteriota bacterium]